MVRPWRGKPTLFIRNQPVYASFYALTDCPGGRFSFEEGPRLSIRQFVQASFKTLPAGPLPLRLLDQTRADLHNAGTAPVAGDS